MTRRILALLLAILMSLTLFGCKQETEERSAKPVETEPKTTEADPWEKTEPGSATPLLYRVSDEQGNVIWLFGSIHVGKEEYFALPDYVMDAYHSSDALAVEADIVAFEKDMTAQVQALQKMMYTDGTDISDHISEELYDRAVTIMENAGMYYAALDYYKPVIWWSFLQSLMMMETPDVQIELGIDRYFLNLAKEDGTEVLEVESAEFQYDLMANFSEELQVFLLEDTIEICENQALAHASILVLMNLWAGGNEDTLAAYLSAEMVAEGEDEELLLEEYNNAMIVSRNQSMTEYAENALASGKEVFICVGAAHVVGQGAMAENLRQLGYTVELING